MHGTVVSSDQKFASVICSVIESLDRNSARWCSDWSDFASESNSPDLLICHVTGREETDAAKQRVNALKSQSFGPILVIGDDLSMLDKVEFIKSGALECLERPVNLRRICSLVQSISISHRARQAAAGNHEKANQEKAKLIRLALEQEIEKLAAVDVNVMLTGETGVGKTYWARQIHERSLHRKHPFVSINCGAIPEGLIESELFGHKKGSFTGADANRVGSLAYAGRGTVLLDELDALPAAAQAKLLHAVEDRVFHPVGSNETVKLQARILAATNKSLEELVDQGKFRADLFYRLDVYEINISPLRERRQEIPRFVRLFADEFTAKYNRPSLTFSREASRIIEAYAWPGNLRQLRNCVEHAAINCDENVIRISDLPLRIVNDTAITGKTAASPAAPGQNTIDSVMVMREDPAHVAAFADPSGSKDKRSLADLLQALKHCNNNRTLAARELGISRAALYKMLSRFDLR